VQLQYNKITLQALEKGLKIRQAALPVIRSKEAALRLEVVRQNQELERLIEQQKEFEKDLSAYGRLWNWWCNDLLELKEIVPKTVNFAGVKYQLADEIRFERANYNIALFPHWLPELLKSAEAWYTTEIDIRLRRNGVLLLEKERKRTTQKLNLFEKVQIPEFEQSIRKIKRFLEDEETLGKATQKLVKLKKEEV
jgi:V/A-type H+-transporting ATPase subunit D